MAAQLVGLQLCEIWIGPKGAKVLVLAEKSEKLLLGSSNISQRASTRPDTRFHHRRWRGALSTHAHATSSRQGRAENVCRALKAGHYRKRSRCGQMTAQDPGHCRERYRGRAGMRRCHHRTFLNIMKPRLGQAPISHRV